MTTLLKNLQKETSKVFTENYDTAFETTGSANLDFFASCGALRHNQEEVARKMQKALYEDSDLAILNLLYLRDIRGGLGERDSFRTAYKVLARYDSEKAIKLLPAIIEYGRFDDILVLLDNLNTRKEAISFLSKQLNDDIDNMKSGKNVSLCAKWMPSINASSTKTKKYAKRIIKELGITEKEYRLMLSALREYLNVIEKILSAKEYSFDYAKIPSKALMKYTKVFMRNDKERFNEYKKALKEGKEKAKTSAVYPYEIIKLKDEELKEVMWRDIKRDKGNTKTIVVRDGSGSMYSNCYGSTVPIDVATSLAILFSEQLTGAFANKFITFSMKPRLVDLSSFLTLEDKLEECFHYTEVANTDIMAVYKLILEAEKKCSPEDYIERIVIISDMQFDMCAENVPTYETAKMMFAEAGIPLPEIVFWNVASRADFPTQDLEHVKLVSGASQYIIDGIINSTDINAHEYMIETLSKYKASLELIK